MALRCVKPPVRHFRSGAPRTDVVRKPAGASFETAATIPTAFFTANYGLLQLARLKQGDRVLIHAASRGVGQAAVPLARAVGAEIFATASPGKWEFLTSKGVQRFPAHWTGRQGVDEILCRKC